ncbi:AlpA family transcriptional regulator [Dyella sp.]|uniref:helix-turn-helix transcriptional regulator n=1 Tax=Dyella sp. TaxID=1869338 RepID=UPI002B558406|nr:AlpA family transcriptional regulator [Rhodanobacteraceae bacterium]
MPIDTDATIAPEITLLRLPQVKAHTGLSRSELYRRMDRDEFPKPVKIGQRASAWSSVEIQTWIAERIAERDAKKRA